MPLLMNTCAFTQVWSVKWGVLGVDAGGQVCGSGGDTALDEHLHIHTNVGHEVWMQAGTWVTECEMSKHVHTAELITSVASQTSNSKRSSQHSTAFGI